MEESEYGVGNVGMGLTEVAPPDPGHISLTCGVGFVEVARGTRGLVHRRMRLCGECECEGVRV